MTSKRGTCVHFAPHGSGILTAGYAMMDAYKDKCWWCEIDRQREEIARLTEIVQKEGFSDGTSICTGCDQRVPEGWPYCAFCGAQGRRPTEGTE